MFDPFFGSRKCSLDDSDTYTEVHEIPMFTHHSADYSNRKPKLQYDTVDYLNITTTKEVKERSSSSQVTRHILESRHQIESTKIIDSKICKKCPSILVVDDDSFNHLAMEKLL